MCYVAICMYIRILILIVMVGWESTKNFSFMHDAHKIVFDEPIN